MRLDFVVILVLKQVKSALIICDCVPILKLVTSAVILPKSYYPAAKFYEDSQDQRAED